MGEFRPLPPEPMDAAIGVVVQAASEVVACIELREDVTAREASACLMLTRALLALSVMHRQTPRPAVN